MDKLCDNCEHFLHPYGRNWMYGNCTVPDAGIVQTCPPSFSCILWEEYIEKDQQPREEAEESEKAKA